MGVESKQSAEPVEDDHLWQKQGPPRTYPDECFIVEQWQDRGTEWVRFTDKQFPDPEAAVRWVFQYRRDNLGKTVRVSSVDLVATPVMEPITLREVGRSYMP